MVPLPARLAPGQKVWYRYQQVWHRARRYDTVTSQIGTRLEDMVPLPARLEPGRYDTVTSKICTGLEDRYRYQKDWHRARICGTVTSKIDIGLEDRCRYQQDWHRARIYDNVTSKILGVPSFLPLQDLETIRLSTTIEFWAHPVYYLGKIWDPPNFLPRQFFGAHPASNLMGTACAG